MKMENRIHHLVFSFFILRYICLNNSHRHLWMRKIFFRDWKKYAAVELATTDLVSILDLSRDEVT